MWPGRGSPRSRRRPVTLCDPSRMCDHSSIRLPKAAMTGERVVLCCLSELGGASSGYKPEIWFISNDESNFESRQEKYADWKNSVMPWSYITALSCQLLPANIFCAHIWQYFYKFRDPKSAIKQEASTMNGGAVRLPSLPVILLLTILMTASRHLM